MMVELLVESIENYLPILSKILPAQSQIPILSHILLEAKEEGLFVTASNIDFGVQIKIPAKISEEGKVAIPGKYFVELVAGLPKEKFTIRKEQDSVEIITRGNKFILQTLPAEEFPKIYDEKSGERVEIKKELIEKALARVLVSTAQEETRPELTGVCFKKKEKKEEIVTTDGYRLTHYTRVTEDKSEGETVILSSKLVQEIVNLKKEGILYIDRQTNQALFETGDVLLVGRLIAGRYPQYEKILPHSFKSKVLTDRLALLQEIHLAAIMARENANIIKLTFSDNMLLINAKSSGVGEGVLKKDVIQEGEGGEISFNARYLLDALKNQDGEEIMFEFNNGIEPVKLSDPKEPALFHIIMPVKVAD